MPFITRLPALTGADPYPDALLALDFVGARRGPQYYKALGVTTADITKIPGWTYTGGTPAGTGSYAARADGSLQFFPSYTNLLLSSQNITGTGWTKSASVTTTANSTTAPDGTTTAGLAAYTNTSDYLAQNSAFNAGTSETDVFSFYVKKNTGASWTVQLTFFTGGTTTTKTATFNLDTLAVTNCTLTAVSGGWYRVEVTHSNNSTGNTGRQIGILSNAGSTSLYIWGAQLELGSTASTYIPTTTAAVTVGTPRITDAGYWAEEARTNSIRNNSMVGAVAGTPGTLPTNWVWAGSGTVAANVVGFGTGAYGPYIDIRFAGTPTASSNSILMFETSNQIAAVNAQVWSPSMYLALTAGSVSNFGSIAPRVEIRNAANGFLSSGNTTPTIVPTATTALSSGAYTIANASTAFIRSGISAFHTDTSAVDITLRISSPQLELGSFATSPIPTTSVAVTRAADVGYVSGLVVPSAGTMIGSFTSSGATAPGNEYLAAISDGTTNNRVTMLRVGGDNSLAGRIVSGGVAYNPGLLTGSWTTGRYTAAIAYAVGLGQTAIGGTASTTSSPASIPAMSRLTVGNNEGLGTSLLNGPIRRIVIYPRAFGNSELQAITTAGAY